MYKQSRILFKVDLHGQREHEKMISAPSHWEKNTLSSTLSRMVKTNTGEIKLARVRQG